MPIEDHEYLAGGSSFMHGSLKWPGVNFTFEPAIHDQEIPLEIEEYNQAIEVMYRETAANFPDPRNLGRFYREVKKDGSGAGAGTGSP